MKKRNIFIGSLLVLFAIGILLDAFGIFTPIKSVVGDISIISFCFGIGLIIFSIFNIAMLHLPTSVISLAIAFMLFEKNIAFICKIEGDNIINNWVLAFAAIILAIGLKLIFPKKAKEASTKFGESTFYLDSKKKKHTIRNHFGECRVYFENTECYEGDATLQISNAFGETTILVPSEWRINSKLVSSFGEYHIPKYNGTESDKVLNVIGSNRFGETRIIYI